MSPHLPAVEDAVVVAVGADVAAVDPEDDPHAAGREMLVPPVTACRNILLKRDEKLILAKGIRCIMHKTQRLQCRRQATTYFALHMSNAPMLQCSNPRNSLECLLLLIQD